MRVLGCIWKIISIVLMVIGAITVVAGIVLGVFLWNFSQPTAIEKEMHPVEISEQAAQAFNQKWDDFEQQAKQSPVGTVIQMVLTESEVSSKLMKEIGKIGLPFNVSKTWVNFLPGSVHVLFAAEGNILFVDVHIGGKAYIEIRQVAGGTTEYELWYNITEINFGHLPSSIQNIIMQNISDRMTGTWVPPADWNLNLQSINVQGGNLVIQGITVSWGPTS